MHIQINIPWLKPWIERLTLAFIACACMAIWPSYIMADTPKPTLSVATLSAQRVGGIEFDGGPEHISGLNLNMRLRSGHMYDLLRVNELINVHPLSASGHTQETRDGVRRAVYNVGGDGVELRTEYTLDPARGVLDIHYTVTHTGPRTGRYQIQLQPNVDMRDDAPVVLMLPLADRLENIRPDDPSAQRVADQDGHQRNPRNFRLGQPFVLLLSPEDRCGILIETDNTQFVSSWERRRGDTFFNLNSRMLLLEKGQSHTEAFRLRLVQGLGRDVSDPLELLSGHGAMLEQRFVTRADAVLALFTPMRKVATRATIRNNEKVLDTVTGQGDLTLDVSGFKDGSYEVELSLGDDSGNTYHRIETLTLWSQRTAEIDIGVAQLRDYAATVNTGASHDPVAAAHRLELLQWKLDEVDAYLKLHEMEQAENLLKDAREIRRALESERPAQLPQPGEIIYRNDFARDSDDFMFFGTCELTFDPESGMTVMPSGTTNLWSRFELEGSYMVQVEFHAPAGYRGGSFIQLNGEAVNPAREDRLMASASYGSMYHYNFGINTYHVSFSAVTKQDEDRNESRIRKTGDGFYILSKARDVIEHDTWHELTVVKNGNQLLFFVDGVLNIEYFDTGNQGPILDKGRLGFRVWGGSRASFRNLRVSRIDG